MLFTGQLEPKILELISCNNVVKKKTRKRVKRSEIRIQ